MIGYGLADVRHAPDSAATLTDPRINPDSRLLTGEDCTLDRFLTFLDGAGEEARMEAAHVRSILEDDDRRWHLYDPERAVVWHAEYGLPTVLCLRPTGTAATTPSTCSRSNTSPHRMSGWSPGSTSPRTASGRTTPCTWTPAPVNVSTTRS